MTDDTPRERSLARLLETSRVAAALSRPFHPNGPLAALRARVVGAARASAVYRWLTAEPDADLVVVDLRDSYTFEPLLAAVECVVARVRPSWRRSRVKRLVDGGGRLVERALDTRPGKLLLRLVQPPPAAESPDEESASDAEP